MSPPIDLGHRAPPPGRDTGRQRVLLAPVLAAATVALCGLAADRSLLLAGRPQSVILLFVAVAAGASFAAGLYAGRRSLPPALAISAAASVTAALLLRRVALLRAADPDFPSLSTTAILASITAGGIAATGLALVGARIRSAIGRPRH